MEGTRSPQPRDRNGRQRQQGGTTPKGIVDGGADDILPLPLCRWLWHWVAVDVRKDQPPSRSRASRFARRLFFGDDDDDESRFRLFGRWDDELLVVIIMNDGESSVAAEWFQVWSRSRRLCL